MEHGHEDQGQDQERQDVHPLPLTPPSVTVVLGSGAALASHFAALERAHPPAIRLETDLASYRPLCAARTLLAVLRARIGPAADEALAPGRALLSLFLRGLSARLGPEEARRRADVSAELLGHLPTNELHVQPILEAWAEAIAAILVRHGRAAGGGERVVLLVPSTAAVDSGSFYLIRPLLRRIPAGERPRVVVGHDPDGAPADPIGRRVARMNADELSILRALPGAEALDLASPAGAPPADPIAPSPRRAIAAHPLDDGLEIAAADALAAGEGPLDPGARRLVVDAIRASFGGYGFVTALRLARDLLRRGPAGDDAAELHTIAAISALHAGDPRPGPDDPIARWVDEHLERASALETDPARRAHLVFRRCIRTGRAGADPERALALGDAAVEAARAPGIPAARAAFIEAWCRNARAYASFRLGRLPDAARDCEEALAILDRAEGAGGVPPAEIEIARFHLTNNLVRVAFEAGDTARAQAWQERCLASEAAVPEDRRARHRWYSVELDLEDLDGSIPRYAARVEDARRRLAPDAEAMFRHDLAVLHHRRGDAAAAHEHFAATAELCRRLRVDPGDVWSADLNAAVTAYHAGLLDEAAQRFDDLIARLPGDDPCVEAELRCALSLVAARRGDAARADAELEAASACVDGSPSEVRVQRARGDALLALGRRDEARRAFAAACAVEDAAPEDRLGALVGLYDAGDRSDAVLAGALGVAPAALLDANAWWDVRRLLDALAEGAASGFFRAPAAEDAAARRDAARRLAALCRRRPDCRDAADRLLRLL